MNLCIFDRSDSAAFQGIAPFGWVEAMKRELRECTIESQVRSPNRVRPSVISRYEAWSLVSWVSSSLILWWYELHPFFWSAREIPGTAVFRDGNQFVPVMKLSCWRGVRLRFPPPARVSVARGGVPGLSRRMYVLFGKWVGCHDSVEGFVGIRFASFDISMLERCIWKSVIHAGCRLSVEEWAQGSAEGGHVLVWFGVGVRQLDV